jgi:phosphatidylethanolamine-binding protein (PEBP) family uncharacterized protein
MLHWMIFNIPRTALELPEGTPATAQVLDCTVQAKNIRNNVGYMGMGDGAMPLSSPHVRVVCPGHKA